MQNQDAQINKRRSWMSYTACLIWLPLVILSAGLG